MKWSMIRFFRPTMNSTWPQPSKYAVRPSPKTLIPFSYGRMTEPEPLAQDIYDSYEKGQKELAHLKEACLLEQQKIKKIHEELLAAENSLNTTNKWCRTDTKLAYIERLKHDYMLAKNKESSMSDSLIEIEKKYLPVKEIIENYKKIMEIYEKYRVPVEGVERQELR